MRLKETQAGQAVRLLEESKFQVFGALPIAAAYNKAEPSTPAADHKQFDADLSICVDSALARVRWLILFRVKGLGVRFGCSLFSMCALRSLRCVFSL